MKKLILGIILGIILTMVLFYQDSHSASLLNWTQDGCLRYRSSYEIHERWTHAVYDVVFCVR